MRFAVIGAGAVGCYYGGRLAQHGEDVHFLCRSDYVAVKARGLRIASCDGDFHVEVNAYADVREMPKADVVIVALKGFDSPALRALLPPLLHDSSLVLTLQNGFGNEEIIAEICGPGIGGVIAGTAFICSERSAPGVISHTSAGFVRIARFFASSDKEDRSDHRGASIEEIATRFKNAGIKCAVDTDWKRVKWTKLVWNVPFSGLAIYYGGVTTDMIMNDPVKLSFARGLMEEVIVAARADGVMLDSSLVATNLEATTKMGAYRPSMLVDFLNSRPLETQQIFAEPLRRGEIGGATLPLMRKLLTGVERATSR